MGCCKSKPAPVAASRPPQQQRPQLTQAQKNQIAVEGLKDALRWALDEAVAQTSDAAYWTGKPASLPGDLKAKGDGAAGKLEHIPLVGKKMAGGIREKMDEIRDSLSDASCVVAKDTATKKAFLDAINALTVDSAMALVSGSGGVSACTDYLDKTTGTVINEKLRAVADESLKNHRAAQQYNKFQDHYNSASEKLPGDKLDPIDVDLSAHVTSEAQQRIVALMREKEGEIRKAPAQAVNKKVAEVFGKSPDQWSA